MSADASSANKSVVYKDEQGRPYVRDEELVAQIARLAREGRWCTIIGPRYSRKSWLLRDVWAVLRASDEIVTLFLDLLDLPGEEEGEFLAAFARRLQDGLRRQAGLPGGPAPDKVTAADLERLLLADMRAAGTDVVLLLDHIEKISQGPLRVLLNALRAAYQDPQQAVGHRFAIVTAGSLSVAALSFSETSPLRIAHKFLVRDLAATECDQLVEYIVSQAGYRMTAQARARLFSATGGDHYLVTSLCERCLARMGRDATREIGIEDVEQVVRLFCEQEAGHHPALLEAIRAIEASPESLQNVLQILRRGVVPARELCLEPGGEVDDLLLTGAVREEGEGEARAYRIRNEVYDCYLRRHFRPEHVARVLSMAGRWDAALDHLGECLAESPALRPVFLETAINAAYTAANRSDACRRITDYLRRAFGAVEARVYLVDQRNAALQLEGQSGTEGAQRQIPLAQRDTLEVVAYLGEDYVISTGSAGERRIAVPLQGDDRERLGVAVLSGGPAGLQSEEFLELLAHLRLAGRAIGAVARREQQVLQLAALNETGRQLTASLDLEHVLRATVAGAIRAVPAAQKGSLYLWDEETERLIMRCSVGFSPDVAELLQLRRGEGLAGRALVERKPYLCGDVRAEPQHKYVEHPDLCNAKSSIGVPLVAWDCAFGVLCVDNDAVYHAFRRHDVDILSAFAAQAALAIHNARLHAELNRLAGRINQGDLDSQGIFQETVRSMARVSGAMGFNMLLWPEGSEPLSTKPTLSVSRGLGEDYDQRISPRPDGLSKRAITTRRPQAITGLEEQPSIHPLAYERGTRAYLCLPMMIQDVVIGVLHVHYDRPHVFTENEIQMLSLFSNQAALAIKNVRLVEQLRGQMRYVAHATKTPLTSIGLLVDQIYRPADNYSAEKAYWAIRASLADLNRVLTNILSLSRHEHGRLTPVRKVFDLSRLIADTVTLFSLEANDKGVRLIGPGQGAPLMAWGDREMIALVLHNLVKNALDAFENLHRADKQIAISAAENATDIFVEVRDNGRGIALSEQGRVFQPFYPGSHRTGIGLYISRVIAQLHEGDLTLESQPGAGTTFRFSLPRKGDEIQIHEQNPDR